MRSGCGPRFLKQPKVKWGTDYQSHFLRQTPLFQGLHPRRFVVNLGVKQTALDFLKAQRSSSSDQHCRHSSEPCSWKESYIWCLTLWYLFMKKRLICVTPPLLPVICGSCLSQLLYPSFSLLCFLRCHFPFSPTHSLLLHPLLLTFILYKSIY